MQQIGTTNELKLWLNRSDARDHLLSLHGIGPKTYDYLCCLVGIDCIAVDRHVRTFANEAGVAITDYDQLKSVVSYAADLLGMSRRDFDAWIWRTVSARNMFDRQLSLNLPA
jgi:endonuclease III